MNRPRLRRSSAAALAAALALAAPACANDASEGGAPGFAPVGTTGPVGSVPEPTDLVVAAIDRDLATTVEQVPDLPGYNVYRPADLGATGAPLPVVVWANGGCLRYDAAWSRLLERWAAAGFVVVAITAPADVDPRTAGMTTADDQAAAIDWAESQDDRPGSAYAGHLDLGRVVAAGNSCGGVTALNLAARDDRVASAFVLSGSSALPGSSDEAAAAVMGAIDVPVGYVIGGPEDISTAFAQRDHQLLPAGVPGYLARRASATHPEVSTDPAILDEVGEISTTWIAFSLTGDRELGRALVDDPCAACPPGTWTVEATDLAAITAP